VAAVKHLAELITSAMAKVKEHAPEEIKFHQEATLNAKVQQKKTDVELCVKMLSVAVAAIQFIHMVLVNVSRFHDQTVMTVPADKREAESMKQAMLWAKATKPEKVIEALRMLLQAVESAKDPVANGQLSDVQSLAD